MNRLSHSINRVLGIYERNKPELCVKNYPKSSTNSILVTDRRWINFGIASQGRHTHGIICVRALHTAGNINHRLIKSIGNDKNSRDTEKKWDLEHEFMDCKGIFLRMNLFVTFFFQQSSMFQLVFSAEHSHQSVIHIQSPKHFCISKLINQIWLIQFFKSDIHFLISIRFP